MHDLKDEGVEDIQILVVWGLRGAGKSQLVLKYIREYRRDYVAVIWIEAGSKEQCPPAIMGTCRTLGFGDLQRHLTIPLIDTRERALRCVKQCLLRR